MTTYAAIQKSDESHRGSKMLMWFLLNLRMESINVQCVKHVLRRGSHTCLNVILIALQFPFEIYI